MALTVCVFSGKYYSIAFDRAFDVMIWCYTLCQPLNGFVGSIVYRLNCGKGKQFANKQQQFASDFKTTGCLQLLFLPLIISALILQLNTAFLAYGTTVAITASTILGSEDRVTHSFLQLSGL